MMQQLQRRLSAVCLGGGLCLLAGCSHQASVPPSPPSQQQVQQIQSNPNLPPALKAMKLRQVQEDSGPPPAKPAAAPSSTP